MSCRQLDNGTGCTLVRAGANWECTYAACDRGRRYEPRTGSDGRIWIDLRRQVVLLPGRVNPIPGYPELMEWVVAGLRWSLVVIFTKSAIELAFIFCMT
jgi:hypothetical protein